MKKSILLLVIISLFVFTFGNSYAKSSEIIEDNEINEFTGEGDERMQPYLERAREISDDYGTSLIICRDPAEAYEDFVLKFTSMSMEEFDSYMSKACLDHIEQEAKANIFIPSAEIEDALTRENPVMQTQKYYYSYPLNNNYLSISANVMYINGSYKYVSGISGYSYGSDAYPEYRPYSISSTFSSDYEYVNVTFSCYKYTGPNSSDGITYTIIKTFKAGNGDYYGWSL